MHRLSPHWPTYRLSDSPTLVSYWRPDLLQQAGGVHLGLELDDLAATDGEERDASEFNRLPLRRKAEQIAVMVL
jgi:hypothetical protein